MNRTLSESFSSRACDKVYIQSGVLSLTSSVVRRPVGTKSVQEFDDHPPDRSSTKRSKPVPKAQPLSSVAPKGVERAGWKQIDITPIDDDSDDDDHPLRRSSTTKLSKPIPKAQALSSVDPKVVGGRVGLKRQMSKVISIDDDSDLGSSDSDNLVKNSHIPVLQRCTDSIAIVARPASTTASSCELPSELPNHINWNTNCNRSGEFRCSPPC